MPRHHMSCLIRADEHFFRAAASGDQSDAGFNQSDVSLRGGVDAWSQEVDDSVPRYRLE